MLGLVRHEGKEERADKTLAGVAKDVAGLRAALAPPDAIVIGPSAPRSESERFATERAGTRPVSTYT